VLGWEGQSQGGALGSNICMQGTFTNIKSKVEATDSNSKCLSDIF